ncbi:MAG: type II secretion system F family protein [Candidatus Woesearchaeota archaeon]|nr:type II secretion system F family protein [Candidatus Woesearchaeota archaeon]
MNSRNNNHNKSKLSFLKNIFKTKKHEESLVERRKKIFIEHLRKTREEKKKERKRLKLRAYLERAGLALEEHNISKWIFDFCVLINLAISFYLMYFFSVNLGYTLAYVIFTMFFLWIFVFIAILLLLWLIFYVFLDLKIFKRKVTIEQVLPDFLQLTASNVRAGMPIDRALWSAIRPRFGVLAKEVEDVAKETMTGEDLEAALQRFSDRYDSDTLKRSVTLIIEGIGSGGEIADLLNKIALNIKESQTIKKEMSANVTTYMIFISFATVLAAPFLFALSNQLLIVINKMTGIAGAGASSAAVGFPISFSNVAITPADFKIFAICSLLVTSFFSAIIVAIINKGDVKSGIKYVPVFMIVTLLIFLGVSIVLERLLGGIF